MATILLAEDDEIMRITLYDRLKSHGWQVDQAADGKEALVLIRQKPYHVVVSDIRMPGMDGVRLMEQIKELTPMTDVILMTAYGRVEDAVNCLKLGAADYILKPFDMDDLCIRVQRLLEAQSMKNRCALLEEETAGRTIIGNSPATREVLDLIRDVAATDSTVLVTGESGTGKELVATAIHTQSRRRNKPFIRINCAAIPETLIESELFGHERGAFTGAETRRAGKFVLAEGGSLLLDEIGDMPLSLQVKLLRVLQEKEVEPIGAVRPISIDVRIICSTAMDLAQEVKSGTFRKDLYYRLNVIPIEIPPLRERKEDIPVLCEYFLNKFRTMRRAKLSLSPEAHEVLLRYQYPGNVRELRNILERVSVLAKGEVVERKDLPRDILEPIDNNPDETSCNLAITVAKAEQDCINKALRQSAGNKTEAARILGISRKNLWEKLK
ncbi:MAG: sigma-54 dependent transcriptional regulator [Desulfobulbaceae bacterium]|nr:sigma-54 dependent transcriptional regulator [Desulfobulbaceae bacterium]